MHGSAVGKYILNEQGEPVAEPDALKWATWFETGERSVARDDLGGGVVVSTVFLGLDHQFGVGPPVLWETIVFGEDDELDSRRYTSRQDALRGHAELVADALTVRGRTLSNDGLAHREPGSQPQHPASDKDGNDLPG